MNLRSERSRKTLDKFGRIVVAMLLLAFSAPILLVLAELAWIAYRPLPHIPRYGVQYSLKDAGPIGVWPDGSGYLDFYARDPLTWGWRLTPIGTVAQLDAAAEASDKARRDRAALHLVKLLGLKPDADTYDDAYPVDAVSPNGHALVFQGDTLWLWQNGQFVVALPPTVRGFYKARGYSWPIFFGNFHAINAQNVVIGDGRIATAGATSGGTSDPHGRWVPLVWRPGYRRVEDLNSRIDPASGWYLDQAVDINGRGQILCVGRRTDEKGAENYQQEDAHWVVLTPQE